MPCVAPNQFVQDGEDTWESVDVAVKCVARLCCRLRGCVYFGCSVTPVSTFEKLHSPRMGLV